LRYQSWLTSVRYTKDYQCETMRGSMTACNFNRYDLDLNIGVDELASGREVAHGKIGVALIDKLSRKDRPQSPTFLAKTQLAQG
jgi:hypothetical protein